MFNCKTQCFMISFFFISIISVYSAQTENLVEQKLRKTRMKLVRTKVDQSTIMCDDAGDSKISIRAAITGIRADRLKLTTNPRLRETSYPQVLNHFQDSNNGTSVVFKFKSQQTDLSSAEDSIRCKRVPEIERSTCAAKSTSSDTVKTRVEETDETRIEIVDYPYSAAVLHYTAAYGLWAVWCGGSLISTSHVLTAADCVVVGTDGLKQTIVTYPADEFKIRYGSTSSSLGGYLRTVQLVFVHPLFYTRKYNVAVLKVDNPVSESVGILPVANPSHTEQLRNLVRNGTDCVLTGWGYTLVEDPTAVRKRKYDDRLKLSQQRLLTWKECSKRISKARRTNPLLLQLDSSSELCAVRQGGPCLSDAGNPLVCQGVQFGVLAWTYGCLTSDQPDVFTRLDNKPVYDFVHFSLSFEYRSRASWPSIHMKLLYFCTAISIFISRLNHNIITLINDLQ